MIDAVLNSAGEAFLRWLLISSVSATLIAGVVMSVQMLFGRRLTPTGRQRLWLLVVIRLLLPVLPASALSVWNLRPGTPLTTHGVDAPVSSVPAAPSMFVTTVRIKPMPGHGRPASEIPLVSNPPALAARRNWIPIILLTGWAAIALALLFRLVWANTAMSKRLRGATVVMDESVLQRVDDCAKLAGLRRVPQVVVTDAVSTPAVFGVFRPRILLPTGLIETLTPTQQRHIILHELSHIRHHDVLANWLLALLSIIHWFNPLLWLAFTRLKSDRELARDAWVIRVDDQTGDADGYANTLIDLAQRISLGRAATWPQLAAPMPALFGRKTSLRRRLQMISRLSDSHRGSQTIGMLLLVVIAGGLLTRARAQTPPRPSVSDTSPQTQPDHLTASRPSPQFINIEHLRREAQQQINRGKYAAALQIVRQILALDPKNDYASGVAPLLEDKVAFMKTQVGSSTKPDAKAAYVDSAARMVQTLNRVLPTMLFDAVGFNDVVDFLRDISGANIFVNWKVLETAGIDRNTPVTVNVRNVKFSKALDLILDSLGSGKTKLGYTIDQGVITISTKDDLQKDVVIRVYDVRDLLTNSPMDASVKPGDVGSARQRRIDELTKLIQDNIDRESWKDNGGKVGSLRVFDPSGQLIVTQTPENHRSLIGLLDGLRSQRGIQILLEAEYLDCDSAKLAEEMKTWWTPLALKPPTTRETASGVILLPGVVEARLEKFKASGNASLLASPRFMLLDGQQASVQTSMKRTYVGDYTAVHGADGQTRYEPVQRTVEPGVEIDAQATVGTDHNVVKLTMHPKVSTLANMVSKPWPGRPDFLSLVVEVPQLDVAEAQVSAMVPTGRTLVMTVAQPQRGRSLLILVKPTIILPTSVEQKEFPLLSPRSKTDPEPPGAQIGSGTVDLSSHYPWMKK